MCSPRLFALAVALFAASCAHSPGPRAQLPTATSLPGLAFVPADTPYALAMLAPMDPVVGDKLLAKAAARLEGKREALRDVLRSDRAPDRFLAALIEEMHGKLTTAGMTELGFSPRARMLVYGLSVYPVLRMEIGDARRLHATVERVFARAQLVLPEKHLGAQAYWQSEGEAVSIVVAIVGSELVAAAVPTPTVAEALPALFGARKPARSLADAGTLGEIARAHHMDGSLVGFIDVNAMTELILGERQGPLPIPSLGTSAACVRDAHRLVALVPRMVFGYEKLTAQETILAFTFELPAPLREAIAGLSRPVAGLVVVPSEQPLATFGAGIDVAGAVELSQRAARAILAQPFECPKLAELNDTARELAQAVGPSPVQQLLTGVTGVVVTLEQLDLQTSPPRIQGSLLLVGQNAGSIAGMLISKLLPGTAPPTANGRPVALPLASLGVAGIERAYAGLKADRAAIALGEGASERVVALLGARAPARAPLVLLGMDLGRLGKAIPELSESFEGSPLGLGADQYGYASYALEADAALGLTLRVYLQTP